MYDKKGDNLMSSENLNSFELVLYLYTVQSTVCTVYSVYSVYSVCPLPFSGGPPLQGQDSPRCLPPSRSPSSSLRPCRHSHRTGYTFSCRFCLFVCLYVHLLFAYIPIVHRTDLFLCYVVTAMYSVQHITIGLF